MQTLVGSVKADRIFSMEVCMGITLQTFSPTSRKQRVKVYAPA